MMIRIAAWVAVVLLTAACFSMEGTGSRNEINYVMGYEPDYGYSLTSFLNTFFHDGADTVSVNTYLTLGPLTHNSKLAPDSTLVGGFAMCIGLDTVATPDRTPSRFAVYDKGGHEQSFGYAVFHDTTAALMPEHAIRIVIPNDDSSCTLKSLYVQNVQAVVQAVKYGNGLADGPFTEDDHLTLILTTSFKGAAQETVRVKLVDGTHLLDGWKEVDLSKASNVDALDLHLESTRPDLPLYCCLDDLSFHYLEIYQ